MIEIILLGILFIGIRFITYSRKLALASIQPNSPENTEHTSRFANSSDIERIFGK